MRGHNFSPFCAVAKTPLTPALSPQAGREKFRRSEISDLPKIATIVCYQTGMMRFIFDLGIRLATFVASAAAFFRARNRPLGSAVAFPCQFPAGPRGRGNVVPARCAVDLTQVIDCTGDDRPNRADFEAGKKILPDLRERELRPEAVTPRQARCGAPRNRVPRGWSTHRPCACCGRGRRGGSNALPERSTKP